MRPNLSRRFRGTFWSIVLLASARVVYSADSFSGSAAGQKPGDWLGEKFLKIHLEFNVPLRSGLPVGDRYDAEALQQSIRASRVQVVTIMAKDAYGNSFFRTQHGYFDSRLKFDLIKRQLDALHALGIKVLTHYSVEDDSHIDIFHPDWISQDATGKPVHCCVISNRTCLNSPYREEILLPQLEELTRLGLDGLWLDIFLSPEGCFCQYCQRKFRERYGSELTPSEARRFEFWQKSWEEALVEVNRRVRAINPQIVITYNGAHQLSQASNGLVNFFTSESHVNRRTGFEDHQIQARYLRPLRIPFDIQNMTNVERWDDSTLKSAVQLESEFSQAIAQGGRISAGAQLYPWGEYDRVAAETLGEAFKFIEARLPYVSGSRSFPYAAVLTPDGNPGDALSKITSEAGLIGTFAALAQLHLQYDILEGSNGGYNLLSNYKLAIIPQPEATFREPEGRAALEQFLKAGGKVLLISNGKDPGTESLHSLGLDAKTRIRNSVEGTLEAGGIGNGFPFQGDVVLLDTEGSTEIGGLRTGADHLSVISLLSSNVAYVAWPLGRDFYQTGYPELREFLRSALTGLKLDLPYEVEGPANLDVNLMERPAELLLHLVNVSTQRPLSGLMPQIWDSAPVYETQVKVRCQKPQSVWLEPGSHKLPFTYDGTAVHFVVPKADIYEIARIRLE